MDANSARTRPEPTQDGRYVVIDGRRWRATDPSIPEALRQQLVSELMAARRAVGAAVRNDDTCADHDHAAEMAARRRVADAKIALGERGDPWWAPTPDGTRRRIAATACALLRRRDPDASICPSDVARVVGGDGWRHIMPIVREIAGELVEEHRLVATSGPSEIDPATTPGPIRLRRGARFDDLSP